MGAETITLGQVLGWIRDIGSIAILTIIVWGAIHEWWVSGMMYRRVLAERDEYKRELFRVLGLADRATQVLGRATGLHPDDAGDNEQVERHVSRRRT